MGCEEIRDLLALYAGGESYEHERIAVEAHVAVCAACARELDQYRESRAQLATLRDGEAPAGTFKSLWPGVRSELFPRKDPVRSSWIDSSLQYAAVVVVGVAIGFLVHRIERREIAPLAAPAPSAASLGSEMPVQPVGLIPVDNTPRLILRPRPRTPVPRLQPDGNSYYLPRVESIPAGREKDF
jgi:anti-sigma factor RsiW